MAGSTDKPTSIHLVSYLRGRPNATLIKEINKKCDLDFSFHRILDVSSKPLNMSYLLSPNSYLLPSIP